MADKKYENESLQIGAALFELSESLRELANTINALAAAVEQLHTPIPAPLDPASSRFLFGLTGKCDTPISQYLRKF
jgi:hypothetical protein